MKTIAAIDFGSNAIRLTIAEVVEVDKYKVIEKFRFPVRIGKDVFQDGEISSSKQDEIYEVFRKFKSHIYYHHVDEIMAVATSAFRDARNSASIIKNIEVFSGIRLNLISGQEEASLIYNIVSHELPVQSGNTLLVDIGGGSTELIFLDEGKIIKLESFKNGSLRKGEEEVLATNQMKQMLKSYFSTFSKERKIKVVGTGGNLRRLGKLKKKILSSDNATVIEKDEAIMIYNQLKDLSVAQLINRYDLKVDRAEVIVPALKIFSIILNEINPEVIYLPKVGLSDSLLLGLSH